MQVFADAVGNGAPPALEVLEIYGDAPALNAACEARGIALDMMFPT